MYLLDFWVVYMFNVFVYSWPHLIPKPVLSLAININVEL